jgi:hypothetical protein
MTILLAIVCMCIGAILGVCVACLCFMSGRCDR